MGGAHCCAGLAKKGHQPIQIFSQRPVVRIIISRPLLSLISWGPVKAVVPRPPTPPTTDPMPAPLPLAASSASDRWRWAGALCRLLCRSLRLSKGALQPLP